ncbi:MAG: hypothetical protein ABI568_08345 [Pseudarthrobacter sp.]
MSRKSKRPWKGGSTTPSTTCRQGLDLANRFEESSRRVRCALAFGELEFFSRRWMRLGWAVDRETSLELMVDNWCFLLAE